MPALTLSTSDARGLRDVQRILQKIEPELKKQAQKSVKAAAGPILTAARANVPDQALSHWKNWNGTTRRWDPARIRRRLTIVTPRARPGKRFTIVALQQKDAAGAIYEMAGRKSSGRTPSGKAFIANLNALHGPAGRAGWRAIDSAGPQVKQALQQAIEDTVKTLQGAVGGGARG